MQELANDQVKTKPAGVSQHDARTMRDLIATLNNPAITGAVVPVVEKEPAPSALEKSEALPAFREPFTKVLLTGRAGKPAEIAARTGGAVLDLRHLVSTHLAALLGFSPAGNSLAKEFEAWAGGVVSQQYPETLSRLFWVNFLRHNGFKTFGTEGYWTAVALKEATAAGLPVVVHGVDTSAGFKELQKNGFTHFHVMCSSKTVTASDPLNLALDNDCIKKISAQKTGNRLRVIWADDSVPAPSPRFYSVNDFLGELQIVDSALQVQ